MRYRYAAASFRCDPRTPSRHDTNQARRAAALAQEAPDALVKRISQEVLETIKDDKELQAGSYRRVQELVLP